MISIVIPLYNKAASIVSTLQSVREQSYSDYEVIVVDDGSNDDGLARIERYGAEYPAFGERIRIVRQCNRGVSAARNRGIAEAKYERIAFLDADDRWMPTYLEEQQTLAARYPHCGLTAVRYEMVWPDGSIRPIRLEGVDPTASDFLFENYFSVACRSNPPVWSSAVIATRQALEAVGGFPEGVASGEDLLTWARIACRFRIAYLNKPLARFMLDDRQASGQAKRKPADNDIVGKELRKLLREFPHTPGLRHYNGLWHKMRSSNYLRLGLRGPCFRETCKAIRFWPTNPTSYIYLAMLALPTTLQHKIIAMKRS